MTCVVHEHRTILLSTHTCTSDITPSVISFVTVIIRADIQNFPYPFLLIIYQYKELTGLHSCDGWCKKKEQRLTPGSTHSTQHCELGIGLHNVVI